MSSFDALLLGFGVALTAQNLVFCVVGCLIGTIIGVLPGIGPAGALAMLLPITLGLPPVTAIILLAGIYYGAMYGGSTTSILVNIPGEASSVVTTLDGYKMAQQGRAGPALSIAAIGSFVAATLSIAGLMLVAPPLAAVALAFQSPEYVALVLLGLILLSYVSFGSTSKAMMMAALGLLLGAVGSDPVDGAERFTFNVPELRDGLGLVPVIIGLFGVAEVLSTLSEPGTRTAITQGLGRLMPTREDLKRSNGPILRGSALGFFVGLLPGGNTIIASLLSYATERKVSATPERFGHGAIEGVAGPEAANNAAAVSSFVPLLTFGIPTNAVIALLLAALMIHNVLPGPQLITKHPELFWGTIASMYIGNVVLLVLNLPLVGLWVRLLRVPYNYFFPVILLFCAIGVYTAGNSAFDLYIAFGFGVLGVVMRRFGFEPAPLILAFILGPMLEDNLRRTLIVSGGSFSIFLDRPIALALLIGGAAVVLAPLFLAPVKQAIAAAKKAAS